MKGSTEIRGPLRGTVKVPIKGSFKGSLEIRVPLRATVRVLLNGYYTGSFKGGTRGTVRGPFEGLL